MDLFTAALLKGANPEDGGGVGIPHFADGNGDCLLNSAGTLFVKAGQRGVRSSARTLAAKLRLSIVLTGLKYMKYFLNRRDELFGSGIMYTAEVREMLSRNGWHVVPDAEDNWRVGSADCAWLLYLAQLWHVAKQGVWLQQLMLPIPATVVQSNVRVVVPCESVVHDVLIPLWCI